jgi:hypothetical protein
MVTSPCDATLPVSTLPSSTLRHNLYTIDTASHAPSELVIDAFMAVSYFERTAKAHHSEGFACAMQVVCLYGLVG